METPSAFGPWSYQVVDTKLAKETRGGTILQLALYSDLLQTMQAAAPEQFHVVTPDPGAPVLSFRVQDYAAYFRLVRRRLEETVLRDWSAIAEANYPEPVEHCDVCRWWSTCDKRRRDDDHLSLVAGISRLQTRELQKAGIGTLAGLGGLPVPLPLRRAEGRPAPMFACGTRRVFNCAAATGAGRSRKRQRGQAYTLYLVRSSIEVGLL